MQKNKSLWINYASWCLASLFFFACSSTPKKKSLTIIPERVVESQPSWDGEAQDSGIKDYVEGWGFEVTRAAISRYNSLIFLYGGSLVPAVRENDGVKVDDTGKLFLSSEAMVNFVAMSQRHKNGRID